MLKIEGDNVNPKTKKHRQIHCLAISAKRCTLFLKDRHENSELLRKVTDNGNIVSLQALSSVDGHCLAGIHIDDRQ
jgi:hypothetical protein